MRKSKDMSTFRFGFFVRSGYELPVGLAFATGPANPAYDRFGQHPDCGSSLILASMVSPAAKSSLFSPVTVMTRS